MCPVAQAEAIPKYLQLPKGTIFILLPQFVSGVLFSVFCTLGFLFLFLYFHGDVLCIFALKGNHNLCSLSRLLW